MSVGVNAAMTKTAYGITPTTAASEPPIPPGISRRLSVMPATSGPANQASAVPTTTATQVTRMKSSGAFGRV
jgi:hypothetical protein